MGADDRRLFRKVILPGALPYMLTGLYNQHPRAAIKFKALPEKGDIEAFYDSILSGV